METKAQIARKKYGCSLNELTPGEKAAVTRLFNAQHQRTQPSITPKIPKQNSNFVKVSFGRPSINGVKEVLVEKDTTVGQALEQSGLNVNLNKEGLITKSTGAITTLDNLVVDNEIYVITIGVDSSR